MNRYIIIWVDSGYWIDEWINKRMDRWMDGWMDGWMDEFNTRSIDG